MTTFDSPGHPPFDEIPPLDTVVEPFADAAGLRRRWRALMGELGFSEVVLWLAFVEDRSRLIPAFIQMTLPPIPDELIADRFLHLIRARLDDDPDLTVALLLTRPGDAPPGPRDHGWARLLTDYALRHDVPLHPMFLATDVELVPLTG
ncbi:MAG: hypothetical protein QM662_16825 [Gordonia sp. (in: high G+C Gram-positive bacteria)]